MMSKKIKICFFYFLFLFFVSGVSATQQLISLQGKVEFNGNLVDDGNIRVTIHDAPTGGNLIFDSGSDFDNTINDGYFDIMLGSDTELRLNLSRNYWLGIAVNGQDLNFAGAERKQFQSPVGNKISGDFTIETDTFHVDSTNKRVGIGTTSPSTALDIDGTITVSNNILGANIVEVEDIRLRTPTSLYIRTADDERRFRLNPTGVAIYERLAVGTDNPSDAPASGLYVSGSVQANSFYYSSDRSLKKDIIPINGALSKISQLEGIYFKWKENGKESIGMLAQDVEKIFPEAVNEDSKGLKTVNYGVLVAPLIKALQEQQKEIEELKKQQTKIDNLKEEMRALKSQIELLNKE